MNPLSSQQYHTTVHQYDPRLYPSGNGYTHAYPAHPHMMVPHQASAIPMSWPPVALYSVGPAVAPVAHAMQHHLGFHFMEPLARSPLQQTTRRGPPQKPTRTGFACWVGNIPTTASIWTLKDHFARGATDDIMSVFLMTSRNCAFVNYRTEEACTNAISRFNQVPLGMNGARLLCRMKRSESEEEPVADRDSRSSSLASQRGSSPNQLTPEGSPQESHSSLAAPSPESQAPPRQESQAPPQESHAAPPQSLPSPRKIHTPHQERYFVLKSCTKQDLDESFESGTWITQPHVQDTLDEAFRSGHAVYLIFSVNRSREYYGYARMTSSPLDTTSNGIPHAAPAPLEGVRTIFTPATRTAPAGTIVEDPGRNTIFWEAERESQNAVLARPFRLAWCRRCPVSFQQVRGLKNQWNGGKEVKVARDGTELEPAVARTIVDLIRSAPECHGSRVSHW